MLKKVIIWGAVIFVFYYLAVDPHGAAHFVHHAFNGLRDAGKSMTTFVSSL